MGHRPGGDTSRIFQGVPSLGGGARRSRAWCGGACCRTGLALRRDGDVRDVVILLLLRDDDVLVAQHEKSRRVLCIDGLAVQEK